MVAGTGTADREPGVEQGRDTRVMAGLAGVQGGPVDAHGLAVTAVGPGPHSEVGLTSRVPTARQDGVAVNAGFTAAESLLTTWVWIFAGEAAPTGPDRRGAKSPVFPVAAIDNPVLPEVLAELAAARADEMDADTVNRELPIARKAIGWWQRQGWIACDPTIGIERRPAPPDRTKALAENQIDMHPTSDHVNVEEQHQMIPNVSGGWLVGCHRVMAPRGSHRSSTVRTLAIGPPPLLGVASRIGSISQGAHRCPLFGMK